MLNGHRILAVIPARGGSKGVPLKNIHPLCGKPLLAHTAAVVHETGWFDRAVVSTDHPAIVAAAKAVGLEVPFVRPPELSGDRIGDLDVLRHALLQSEQIYQMLFDIVVMLQPTSPLRTPDHVTAAVMQLIKGGWDAAWTVSETPLKYHPLKQLALSDAGRLSLFDQRGSRIVARQELPPVYHRNGVAYAFSRRAVVDMKTILPERCSAVVLHGTFVSIDTIDDFAEAERALSKRI
jgi:CMP-N,N'-diacetyllegionaminic acid synthase